jgi:thymidine kinase
MLLNVPHHFPQNTGWIEVVAGCMFSGKTEELIRRIRRAKIAKQRVIIFKPKIDNRYAEYEIVSHNEQSMSAEIVEKSSEIWEKSQDYDVIGIDEGQFFDDELVKVCNDLANLGKRVIVAGLDQDYRGIPFEPIPKLLAVAEYITKTLAICVVCGNPADKTQRKIVSKERVLVGASDAYEARCRNCHYIPEENHD